MNMNWIMNTALDLNADGTYRAFSPEAWKYAGEMTLMGMAMIFSVLAILTAAVTAYREQEGESGSFRVVSFKRTGGAWNTKR